ncbi:MAG: 50S ribosomal protein L24 [Candidatus Saccharibacteria bacterium]|nr:50S ribosomal protein L24 [Candidatus Saccharibacteria bacterium]
MAQNLKTGDTVKVIAGAHKGETAKIVKVSPKEHKAYLEGINVVERHIAKSAYRPQGGKKTVHLGIDLSNLKKEGK